MGKNKLYRFFPECTLFKLITITKDKIIVFNELPKKIMYYFHRQNIQQTYSNVIIINEMSPNLVRNNLYQ